MSSSLDKNELPAGSRLSRMKAQFQQKQMQEKEHKLLQMLDSQQQRAMQKASMNGVLPSKYANNAYANGGMSSPVNPNAFSNYPSAPGKVRQMFEERRKGGGVGIPANNLYNTNANNSGSSGGHRNGGIIGIDKSYPLDPLTVTPNGKNRTSSSKSDPNPSTTTNNTRNVRNTGGGGGGMKSTNNNNLSNHGGGGGLNKRGISLERTTPQHPQSRDRSRGGDRDRDSTTSSSFSTNGVAPIGVKPRRASSGLSGYEDENSNQVSVHNSRSFGSNSNNTTKYSDLYAQQPGGDSDYNAIAKREKALAMKMKNLHMYDDKPSSPESYKQFPLSSGTSPRSSSPPKRTVVAPPRAKASPPVKPVAPKKTTTKPSAPKARAQPPPGLDACRYCNRFFAPDRLEKHENICKKTSQRKRKVFDPTKMRMEGTEAEPYIRQVSAKKVATHKAPSTTTTTTGGKKADWRKKHEEFIKTIRAAKEYQAHVAAGGNPADLPPPPPSDTSDYIQCPHCGRKFAEAAAHRHIPKCQNIKSNKR